MLRSHTCGELSIKNIGARVTLCGWVNKIRDKGAIIWIDLRDRFGITQFVLEESNATADILSRTRELGREYVLRIGGVVKERENKNPNLPTGDIEVVMDSLEILNKSEVPPFTIDNDTDGGEELRMQHRYLDLRRPCMQQNIILRHRVMQATRAFLNENNFLEIETPMLIRSTPEGACDFVVPSRQSAGNFYALPQSPQLLKQLLMIAGFDRYYQIVKCFRDEDLRADRQPEFTQIDCELSFVDESDVMRVFEGFIKKIFKEIKGADLNFLPSMTYAEAMNTYGSDKPDRRYGMPIVHLKDLILEQGVEFELLKNSALVLGICVRNAENISRKQFDAVSDFVKAKAKGANLRLLYIRKCDGGVYKSSAEKNLSQENCAAIADKVQAMDGDMILLLAGDKNLALPTMGELRLRLVQDLGIPKEIEYAAMWVTEFPLLEWNEEMQRYQAMHHPFTMFHEEDAPLFGKDMAAIRAKAYDLVINGTEIGGGSIRISCSKGQEAMLEILGFSKERAQMNFGFLLEALKYGAPPHGGIALGLDRLCAVLAGECSIRSFIAFPKNNSGRDVMLEAPSVVASEQLKELGLDLAMLVGKV